MGKGKERGEGGKNTTGFWKFENLLKRKKKKKEKWKEREETEPYINISPRGVTTGSHLRIGPGPQRHASINKRPWPPC